LRVTSKRCGSTYLAQAGAGIAVANIDRKSRRFTI
jgi:hypothetical protein